MLLILTNSMDGTTDLLMPFLTKKCEVFRFNIDLWHHYQIQINEHKFEFKDPSSRVINEDICSGLYIRKAYFLDENREKPAGGDIETWSQYQLRSIIDGIYEICKEKCLVRLVERGGDRRIPKIFQLRTASKFFKVPEWNVVLNARPALAKEEIIVKPLSSAFVKNYETLFTTRVNTAELEEGYPWLTQEFIDFDADITSVFVQGEIFSFRKARTDYESIDYRTSLEGQDKGWEPFQLTQSDLKLITALMGKFRLSYGRLDFIQRGNEIFFLEVNPNGQFAWLDPGNKTGLLSTIAAAVTLAQSPGK